MNFDNPSGLPHTLSTLLGQLSCNNMLKNWIVYSNKYNQICCTIRFDVGESDLVSEKQSVNDFTCKYRRVSARQQSRNIHRMAEYRKKRKIQDSPEIDKDSHNLGKSDTPEKSRNDTNVEDYGILSSPEPLCDTDFACSPEAINWVDDHSINNRLHTQEHVSEPLSLLEYVSETQLAKDDVSDIEMVQEIEIHTVSKDACAQSVQEYDLSSPAQQLTDTQVLPEPSKNVVEQLPIYPNNSANSKSVLSCQCCGETMTPKHECLIDSDIAPPDEDPPDEDSGGRKELMKIIENAEIRSGLRKRRYEQCQTQ